MAKEYIIDDTQFFNYIDEYLANIDLSVLEKAREESIKKGESTEIIDKAIKERKRRDTLIKEEQEKRKKISILDIINGITEIKKSLDKKKKNNDYEDYNFEEEDLEEDDYYHDDLD